MEVKDLNHFKQLVSEGKIRDKWYFYKRTEEQKQKQTEELPFLIDFFKTNFNVILYPIYGTLLGMIRENDYIMHDNDIDLAYLSLYSDVDKIKQEYLNICKILKSNGLLAKQCKCVGQLHSYSKSKTYKFDVWTSFIKNNKISIVPLIKEMINKEDLLPFKLHTFRNTSIFIPKNPQKILDTLYNDWTVPIYGIGKERGIRNKWTKIL